MQSRKMVKWAPFAALPEQANYLARLEQEINKSAKPELSEEDLQTIQENYQMYLMDPQPMLITYYRDGYLYEIKSSQIKLEVEMHQMVIDKKQRINLDDIIKLEPSHD